MNIAYKINHCSKLLKNQLNNELKDENITAAQFATIKDIERHSLQDGKEFPITAVEISRRLDIDKPTMSGIINRLVAKDYIKKEVNPEDKRSFLLKLSKESKKKLSQLEKISNSVMDKATEDLTDEEIEILNASLNKIIESVG